MILKQTQNLQLSIFQRQFITEVKFSLLKNKFLLDSYVLQRIEWSDIDQVYRRNRERLKDLSFQKFCSESGFMRYFPGKKFFF